MELGQVYQLICKGKAMLITGSGAHLNAKAPFGEKYVTGSQLASELYSKVGIDDPSNKYDLKDAAEVFIDQYGPDKLIKELKMMFSVAELGQEHKFLYNQNWKRVYTTNYDTIPILSTKNNPNYELEPITLTSSYDEEILKRKLCIYINGYIESLNKDALVSEFKLTESSYMRGDIFIKSIWGNLFSEDLLTSSVIVVVGLSLEYDFDLKRLIYNSHVQDKLVFIESTGLKADMIRKLNKIGSVYTIGVESFSKELEEYRKVYDSTDHEEDRFYNYKSFEEYQYNNTVSAATANQVYGLFMSGILEDNLWYKKEGKYSSVVLRDYTNKIVDGIENGFLVTFIHANLGNGKTMFLEFLKRIMVTKGYKIYTCLEYYQGVTPIEINNIISQDSKVIVIIENYYNYMDVIKQFAFHRNSRVRFVFTSRTVMQLVRFQEVCELFSIKPGEAQEYDFNHLSHDELIQLSSIFTNNGLWNQYSHYNNYQKAKMLEKREYGGSHFQGILLWLLRSITIKERIGDLINGIKKEKDIKFNVLILSLLIKVMSLSIKPEEISSIMGVNIAFDALFKKDPNINELLDFSHGNGEFKLKSSVTALFVLRNLKCNDAIIDVLTKTAEYYNSYRNITKYENVLKNIVSYSHVKTFLKKDINSDRYILKYYDNIKQLDYYNNNPFFWLQFAIACINLKMYDIAQVYLDTAYARFTGNYGIIPFQVETQQANLYLRKIVDRYNCNVSDVLEKAHQILVQEKKHRNDDISKRLLLFQFYTKQEFIARIREENLGNEYKRYCKEAFSIIHNYLNHPDADANTINKLKALKDYLSQINIQNEISW